MFNFGATHAPLTTDDAEFEEPPTVDELALEYDDVVPYPHEHSMQLGMELINVFAADVLVTTTVGSGECFKAVLQKFKYGIGFCRTQTHKQQVLRRLKDYAKLMNLVSLQAAPAKAQQLIDYEMKLQSSAKSLAASSSQAPPPGPSPPAVVDAPITMISGNAPAPKKEAIKRGGPKLAAFGSNLL